VVRRKRLEGEEGRRTGEEVVVGGRSG